MKSFLISLLLVINLFAMDSIMLPLKGIEVTHTFRNGLTKNYTIQREVSKECMNIAVSVENFQSENLASNKISNSCKKSFVTTKGVIQPLVLIEGVTTVAELEVLDFIENKVKKEPLKYILVDSRKRDWFDKGTIPSSTNIPYDELTFDEDFLEEFHRAFKLLGVEIIDKGKYDFSKAKTALLFCNGSWCAQSPRAIKELVKIGYPKDKILWYRGGIAAWAGVSLTLTEDLETLK
ncbi:sulfurtransferase [Halarcobacter ebronensis]|uniref:Sulfurtransferase n=1 Tax=Halarcobacter ebronensis TaxID=1462615 RepID=A0A4Q0YBG8_9BACT|nr:rhodanese-like domain-containing protein [Halarcobacter ebronensis]RXJ67687.1 sulfurtransferase [Halarcobacter ebronensis]